MATTKSGQANTAFADAIDKVHFVINIFGIQITPPSDGIHVDAATVEKARELSELLKAIADGHGNRDHQNEASLSV